MLDEEEFGHAHELYREGFRVKPDGDESIRWGKLLDYYFDITGYRETEPAAIMHHRISQYGPPCENCGKPYRTPEASFCAACGHKRI
jgi:hypothetical protein